MEKTDKNKMDVSSDIWASLLLALAFPKTDYTEIQIAELKGRLDTLEKIILKGE